MGLLRRPTTGEIMEDGRSDRPCGPGAHSRAIRETKLRLRRQSIISANSKLPARPYFLNGADKQISIG
jgi:hypothetical protein